MKKRRVKYGIGGYDPDAPDDNIVEDVTSVRPGLSADPNRIPADGTTPSLCHYAQEEGPADVTWVVNGVEAVESLVEDPDSGLWVSEVEVVTSTPGPVSVECEGESVTVEAV